MVNSQETQSDSHAAAHQSASNNGVAGDQSKEHRAADKTTAWSADTRQASNTQETDRRTREAENAGWLDKNIHALLALAIMLITFAMFIFVIHASMDATFKGSEAKDIVIYILGALTTVATQVVSYYFGSSSGSADKSRALSTIAKRG